MKDVLVDVLVDMPGLVEQFDNMRLCADSNRQDALRVELVQKCWEHDRQLLHWLGLIRKAINLSKQTPAQSSSEDLVTRVARIHGMSLFWTTGLVLYSILQMASGPHTELPQRANPMHHARMLAEALPALLEPSAGLYGQQSAALPLEVALQYMVAMKPATPENEALLGSLSTLKDDMIKGLTRRRQMPHQGASQGIEWYAEA